MKKGDLIAKGFLVRYYSWSALQGMYFLNSFLMIIVTSTGLTPLQISIAVSMYFVIQVVLEIPTGALADRFGRKNIIVLGKIFTFTAFLFIYLRRDFLDLFTAYSFWGMARTLISGSGEALMYDNMKYYNIHNDYAKYEGKSFGIRTISFASSAFLASYIINFGYDAIILSTMIPCFCQIVLMLTMRDEYKSNKKMQKLTSKYFITLKNGFKYAFKHRVIMKFMFFAALFSATIEIVEQYYELFLYHISNNLNLVPILMGMQAISVGLCSFYLTKYFANKKVFSIMLLLVFGCFSLFVAFVFYNLQISYTGSVIFWVLVAISYHVIDSRRQIMIPSKIRATVNSVTGFLFGIAGVLGVFVFGYISKLTAYKVGFLGLSMFQIIILILFLVLFGLDKHLNKREKLILSKN
ncbi:MFS transporter [Pseudomonadota bacterium]